MSALTPEQLAELDRREKTMIETFSDTVRQAITARCQIAAIDGNWMAAAEDLTRYCAERMFAVYG